MTLSERLKNMRESLGLTQKDMAKHLRIASRTWQNYEEGVHEPSWKVLETLGTMGFDMNWLLTGEGEMRRDRQGQAWINTILPGIGKRIREIRGEDSIPVFATITMTDEKTLAEYESETRQPTCEFVYSLYRELQVNPSWLIAGLIPKNLDDIVIRESQIEVVSSLDEKVLREVLKGIKETYDELIEEGLGDESIFHDLDGMTEIIAYCYEDEINKNVPSGSKHKTLKVKRLIGITRKFKNN